ncbi:MAG: leucine-rich repeat protein [Clostridia bacterium]|nr:leucine-rich repeat protein [Clostridia bacterium]
MKKTFAIMLVVIMIASLLPAGVFAASTTYYVGDIEVTIDSSAKTVTVSGAGPMPNYSNAANAPWYKCDGVTEVYIGEGVTTVGSNCFYGNTNIQRVTLSETVTEIGTSAFGECRALTEIVIPSSLRRIEARAFENCLKLATVPLNDGLEYIGSSAFDACSALYDVTLPDTLKFFDASAFNSSGLYKKMASGINTLSGYTLQYKGTASSTVTVPESARVISAFTLTQNSSTSKITIPDGVERIQDFAFYGLTANRAITIPDSVTEIGNFAFGYLIDSEYNSPIASTKFTVTGHGGHASEKYAKLGGFTFVCDHETSDDSTIYPDCTKGGEVIVKCRYCGETAQTYTVEPKTSHAFPAGYTTLSPTCTEAGKTYRVCTLCGYESVTKTLEATGHKPDYSAPVMTEPTCTERGMIYLKCSECGEICGDVYYTAALGHTPSDPVVTTAPTCTAPGVSETFCSVCGASLGTTEIPQTGHTPAEEYTTLIPSAPELGERGFRVLLCTSCGEAMKYEYFFAGDINGDGKFTSKDVSYMKKFISGAAPADGIEANCDLNGDGKITSTDLKLLKKVISS